MYPPYPPFQFRCPFGLYQVTSFIWSPSLLVNSFGFLVYSDPHLSGDPTPRSLQTFAVGIAPWIAHWTRTAADGPDLGQVGDVSDHQLVRGGPCQLRGGLKQSEPVFQVITGPQMLS